MALGLERVVTEVGEEEKAPSSKPTPLVRLRASHHMVARLDAKGLETPTISMATGYATSAISILRSDPSYQELVRHYQTNNESVALQVEEKLLSIGMDYAEVLHERVLESSETVSTEEATNIFKAMMDRAGYAPVQRTVNKNLNLNIGARLDAARKRLP